MFGSSNKNEQICFSENKYTRLGIFKYRVPTEIHFFDNVSTDRYVRNTWKWTGHMEGYEFKKVKVKSLPQDPKQEYSKEIQQI